MSQSFSAFELVQIALRLDPQLLKKDPLEALERAFELLSFAEDHRNELGKNRFVETVDKKIGAQVEAELAEARKGKLTKNFVRLSTENDTKGEFYELLRAEEVHPDLLNIQPRTHLRRLEALGIKAYPLQKALLNNPFRFGAFFLKTDLLRYARSESDRRREKDARDQRRRRARKRSRH